MFVPGQRVRYRVDGNVGYVLRAFSRGRETVYKVGFGGAEWDVPGSDLEPAVDGFESLTTGNPEAYPYETWLKREAMRLTNAYRNDPAGPLSNSRIEPQPHQISVLISCVEKVRPRMILADEVGLGKTIEAGLVLKELRARATLSRVLILVPAGLVGQWTYELRSKFNEIFVPHSGGMLRYLRDTHPDRNPWAIESNVIASMQLACREQHAEQVASADWDLVIVDEAHHARNWWNNGDARPNQAFELLDQLHDKVNGLLLLTATPMQLHEFELFSMISLVEPGLFRDFADFMSNSRDAADINRHVSWLRDRRLKSDPEGLRALLRRLHGPDDVLGAPIGTALERARVADWLVGKHRISQAMLRNRKAYVGGFVTRNATRIPVMPSADELTLEARTRDYIHRRHERALRRGDKTPAFALTTFQKMLCSSSRALAAAFERRTKKLAGLAIDDVLTDDVDLAEHIDQLTLAASTDIEEELTELRGLSALARSITDTKLVELERALTDVLRSNPLEKVLIFTQFLATQEMIRARLAPLFTTVIFNGGMHLAEKEQAVREFHQRAQIMVSTESGGEGRNFQFCHILINYDLPWNPMRIEQRIGRLDRVGQSRNVLIYNFQVRGTLDERILNVLEHRVRVFTESVGALEPILGDVEARLDEICLKEVSEANRAIARYELDLDERLEAARKQDAQAHDLVMDTKSLRRDDVDRLLGRVSIASRLHLEHYVGKSLARYPGGGLVNKAEGVFEATVPAALRSRFPELDDEYIGSFDHKVALADERLEFFAFGHPLVEALISEAQRSDFAPSPGALLGSRPAEPSIVADYELRCSGVRDRTLTSSQLVSTASAVPAPAFDCPVDAHAAVAVDPIDSSTVEALEQASRSAAQRELDDEFERFQTENETNFKDELTRLRKRYAFERRHHEQRIKSYEDRIALLEASPDSESRRTVGGLRGAVTLARRRLTELAGEEVAAVEHLQAVRRPAAALRLLGVARVV